MYVRHRVSHHDPQRGTALLMIAVVTTGLIGLSFGLVAITHASSREQRQDKESVRASYICQAAVANAVFELNRGNSGALGSAETPVAWGTARFWSTRSDPAPDLVRLEATGIEDGAGSRAELVLRRVPNTNWRFGAFAREGLELDSKAHVDSYDSTLGTYASQAVNGFGEELHAGTNGDVGSNGALIVGSESKVWGDASGGPGAGTTVLGSAVVSGTTAALGTALVLPPLTLPSFTDFGALTVSSAATIPASERAYTALTVGADQTLNIVGPARIVVTDLVVEAGGSIEIDASSGPVELWVAHDFVLGADSFVGAVDGRAHGLALNLLGDNVDSPDAEGTLAELQLESEAKVVGMLYAPNAHLELHGKFELFGSLIARTARLDDSCLVHFDEDLLTATAAAQPLFETVCWRELPYVAPAAGGAIQ